MKAATTQPWGLLLLRGSVVTSSHFKEAWEI
jgi:hypothetical protein